MATATTLKRMTAALVAPLVIFALFTLTAPLRAADAAPALWKIEDADSEIWLFGTVHVLDPSLQWRTKKISNAFDRADTLIVEAPVVEIDLKEQQRLVMTYGVNKSAESFITKLSPEGRANFERALTSINLPASHIQNFKRLRPWLAGITVQMMHVTNRGGNPDAGVDTLLWHEAREKGKQIGYFETLDEQMQVFGNLSMKEEMHFFEEGMRQLVEEPDLLDHIVDSWKTGDTKALASKMQAAMIGQDSLYKALLTDRNRNWAQQINKLLKGKGTVFIAVGAAHLAGKDSVQTLLDAKYGIKAVRQ